MKVQWFEDFIDLFYPAVCMGCSNPLVRHENLICMNCRTELPKTGFHKLNDNPVQRAFAGRCRFTRASAYLYFEKGGIVQSLIHNLKYRNKPELGQYLGQMIAHDLLTDGFFTDIDFVIPIPLHKNKLRKRGYNQSERLAAGIAGSTGIALSKENLVRTTFSQTQTRKSRFSRWLNVESIFNVTRPGTFRDKHLLLIDDVITTGSTVESAVLKLEQIKNVKISLLCLAYAK